MQIALFKVFADLAGTGSFSRAASMNGVTQSAVSQQVRAMEKYFGTTLIDRSKRGFALTREGEVFLQASREILRTVGRLEDKLRVLKDEVAGELRVCTIYSIGLHELPPFIRAFRKQFPRAEVVVDYRRSSQVYAAVLEGDAEIGLVAYPARRRGLEVLTFWRDRLVVICPPTHRLAKKRQIALTELEGERFVAFDPDLPTRRAVDRSLKEQGVRIRTVMEFDNIETVKRTVEIDNAVAIVPETAVRGEVKMGTLSAIPVAPEMWRPLGAIVRRGRGGSAARREFLELLKSRDLGG